MSDLEDTLAALNAERYGAGQWFKTPTPGTRRPSAPPIHDDSDTTTARRRRELLAAVEHHYAKEA